MFVRAKCHFIQVFIILSHPVYMVVLLLLWMLIFWSITSITVKPTGKAAILKKTEN